MPLALSVTPVTPVFNPYAAFKTHYHKRLLQLFKAGAVLYVWRCSSPHNWYLETPGDEQYMVAGDRETCEGLGTGPAQVAALRKLAKHESASSQVVSRGGRYENGLPELQGWKFDADAAKLAEDNWAAFQAELAAHEAAAKPPAPEIGKLSDVALALLRTLRMGGYGVPRHPELASAFAELNEQGLLTLAPDGNYRLAFACRDLRLPRGLSLKTISA